MFGIVLFVIVYIVLIDLFIPSNEPVMVTAQVNLPIQPVTVTVPNKPLVKPVAETLEIVLPIEPVKETVEIDGMTVKQLKQLARKLNLKGYSKLRKEQLKLAIQKAQAE